MTNLSLIFPMAFYVFYLWGLTVYLFRTRVGAMKAGSIEPSYFKDYRGEIPEKALVAAQHYDNQFQAPLLFFISCATHLAVGKTNTLTILLAWVFVGTRLLHSHVHLGRNKLKKRVLSFAAGWIVILALWIQLVVFALSFGAA